MSAPRRREPGELSPSRRAALRYLQGDITLLDAGAKFGVSVASVSSVVSVIRQEQRNVWPEDEVTC